MSDRQRLIVVCGLPGTGKTTVARELATRLDGRLVRTDVVRKDLHPTPEYTAAETDATYDEVRSRARAALGEGAVVLDGTFRRKRRRERARSLARERNAAFDLVKVECRDEVVRERIADRSGDASDADVAVYEMLRPEFEQPTMRHHTVDNSGDVAKTRRQVETIVRAGIRKR